MPEGPRKVLIVIAIIIAVVAFVDGVGIWDIADFGMTSNPD
ncbi:hypothetical protein [Ferruginivarius sediminum]|nr:hypothetical protein [Ferruginivarius sediminum]